MCYHTPMRKLSSLQSLIIALTMASCSTGAEGASPIQKESMPVSPTQEIPTSLIITFIACHDADLDTLCSLDEATLSLLPMYLDYPFLDSDGQVSNFQHSFNSGAEGEVTLEVPYPVGQVPVPHIPGEIFASGNLICAATFAYHETDGSTPLDPRIIMHLSYTQDACAPPPPTPKILPVSKDSNFSNCKFILSLVEGPRQPSPPSWRKLTS